MIFIQTRFVSDSQDLGYQHSGPEVSRVDHCLVNNIDTVSADLTAWRVPNGGAPDDSNKLLLVTIDGGKAYLCAEIVGSELDAGDAWYFQASLAETLTISMNGRKV